MSRLAWLLLLLALPALAAEYRIGEIEIAQAWSRATPAAARNGAGYLVIRNRSAAADRLVAASTSAAAQVEMHEMRSEGSVMRMRALPNGIAVPAGGSVTLQPGGLHLMLTGLAAPLRQGTRVPVTLVFERAGRVEIELGVEPPASRGPSGHAH